MRPRLEKLLKINFETKTIQKLSLYNNNKELDKILHHQDLFFVFKNF